MKPPIKLKQALVVVKEIRLVIYLGGDTSRIIYRTSYINTYVLLVAVLDLSGTSALGSATSFNLL